MTRIKPIHATPEISGKDAFSLLNQASVVPSKNAMHKNEMLRSVLNEIYSHKGIKV